MVHGWEARTLLGVRQPQGCLPLLLPRSPPALHGLLLPTPLPHTSPPPPASRLPPQVPERKTDAALRLPISGIYKIKGVGDVLAGRVEQGIVKPGDEVIFMPTHTAANPCIGKVFTVEMHHKRVDKAGPGERLVPVKGR